MTDPQWLLYRGQGDRRDHLVPLDDRGEEPAISICQRVRMKPGRYEPGPRVRELESLDYWQVYGLCRHCVRAAGYEPPHIVSAREGTLLISSS